MENNFKKQLVLFAIVFLVFVNVCAISYVLACTHSLKIKSNTISELEATVHAIKEENSKLASQGENINTTSKKVIDLEKTAVDLSEQNADLLNAQIENEKKIREATEKIQKTQKQITKSEQKITALSQKKIQSYYPVAGTNKHDLEYVKACLKGWQHLIPYTDNVYDCSEMSAHLEWYLESCGVRADIVTSKTHAWVFAHGTFGYIAIETTSKELIYYDGSFLGGLFHKINPAYYDKKINITHVYQSVFDVPDNMKVEFDWWNCKKVVY